MHKISEKQSPQCESKSIRQVKFPINAKHPKQSCVLQPRHGSRSSYGDPDFTSTLLIIVATPSFLLNYRSKLYGSEWLAQPGRRVLHRALRVNI